MIQFQDLPEDITIYVKDIQGFMFKQKTIISWIIPKQLNGQRERTGNGQRSKTKRSLTYFMVFVLITIQENAMHSND